MVATPPPRTGAAHATICAVRPFTAGDGKVVDARRLQNEREWARFCSVVLERPELVGDPRFSSNAARVARQEALAAIIIDTFAVHTGTAVIARLDAAGIANARMNGIEEFLDHPQLESRDRWRQIDSPVGPLRALVPPFNIEGVEAVMGPVPSLGEHTDDILNELGFAPAVVAEWRRQGVVYSYDVLKVWTLKSEQIGRADRVSISSVSES